MPERALSELTVPIWQAPTGSIAGPELAAAVAGAGGMGALGLTWAAPEEAAESVREVRRRTDGLFLVNFALAFPPRALRAALQAGAPVISFSWGDPAPWVEEVRACGALFGVQVTCPSGARRARQLGADFVVCQGLEAGGHVQSGAPLRRLLPQVVATVGRLPVVAAGGIARGDGVAEVLDMGAAGAMLGTRFVATQESRAHPDYRRRLIESGTDESVLTVCFCEGWPQALHRVLRNVTLDSWEAAGSPPPGQRPGEGDRVGVSASGEPILRYEDTAPRMGMSGEVLEMALYAGIGCGVIDDCPPAAELIDRLWKEAQETRHADLAEQKEL